jgi:hypothetical protein
MSRRGRVAFDTGLEAGYRQSGDADEPVCTRINFTLFAIAAAGVVLGAIALSDRPSTHHPVQWSTPGATGDFLYTVHSDTNNTWTLYSSKHGPAFGEARFAGQTAVFNTLVIDVAQIVPDSETPTFTAGSTWGGVTVSGLSITVASAGTYHLDYLFYCSDNDTMISTYTADLTTALAAETGFAKSIAVSTETAGLSFLVAGAEIAHLAAATTLSLRIVLTSGDSNEFKCSDGGMRARALLLDT